MGIEATQIEVFAPAAPLAGSGVGLASEPVESLLHPSAEDLELAVVLHALSDPMRLRIVVGLADGDPRPCGSFGLPVTKSTCTHHFKVLREAGVIHQRLEGTTRLNSLRRDDLERRFPGLLDSVLRAAASPTAG